MGILIDLLMDKLDGCFDEIFISNFDIYLNVDFGHVDVPFQFKVGIRFLMVNFDWTF